MLFKWHLTIIIWLDTGHALTLQKQPKFFWKLWLNHFGMSWCRSLSGGVRSNFAIPVSESIILRQVWYHVCRVCLCLSADKWFFQCLQSQTRVQRHMRIFRTSPSVQSSMIIHTGFSVITPMSFTMWGWSNWRIVTKRRKNKTVCYRKFGVCKQ